MAQDGAMEMDLDAAVTNARTLERRRLHHLLGTASAEHVLAALDAYRNPDGGYGWALEPDLRSVTSQPVAAVHALEVLAEVGDTEGRRLVELCDWLAGHTLPDGGMPFALAYPDTEAPHAYELLFVLRLLDVLAEEDARARRQLDRMVGFVNADGPTPVAGTDEALYPLDFAPDPRGPVRALLDKAAIEADLARLAGRQQADGGWPVDFPAYSPAAALEWRGYATVQAVIVLRDAGR